MELKIIFNNEAISREFSIGWGISVLVDNRILFDTGEKAEYLFNNAEVMNIDVSVIEAVVISHDHWDHTGGLWELLKKRKGLKVYACPGFTGEFKEKNRNLQAQLIEADSVVKITENIFITGQIPGSYSGQAMPEQALIVKTEKGLTVITGCAHPGIVKMVEEVKKRFPKEQLYLVFGGFHLIDKDKRVIEVIAERFKEMEVKKAGPTHCSGKVAEEIFKKRYGNDFISVKAGQTLDV